MSRINDIINKLCPNGVEYTTIDKVIKSYSSGLNPRQNFKLNDTDAKLYYVTVKEITTGKVILSDKTDKITKAAWDKIQNRSKLEINDVLLSGIGTIGKVALVDIPINNWNCSESVILLKPKMDIIIPKYLVHLLRSNYVQEQWISNSVGSTLKGLRKENVLKTKIALPPIEVQKEIVQILDKFGELEAELEARKSQYEFWREKIIKMYNGKNIKLSDMAKIYDGTHSTPNYQERGIPFISVENISNIYGSNKFISEEDFRKYKIKPEVNDVFMTRIGSIGKCSVFDKQTDLAYYVSLALIRPDINIILPKYLKYVIESKIGKDELYKRTLVHAVPIKVNKDEIGKIILPVPSITEQKKIIDKLDKFDKLTESISEGIPAEIELRRQQYEYYRNKLLNFKELSINE